MLLLISGKQLFSQDIQFSQFYSAPLYLNPAFAGSAHHYRAIMHNRWQWPHLQAKYSTYSLSLDHYFNSIKSGVGLMVLNDRQGSGAFSTTEIQALYSYELHLSEQYTFRAGLQAGYLSRFVDNSNFQYTDQFSNQGYNGNTPSGEDLTNPRRHMLDLGAGGIFYSQHAWAGIASHHINQPNQSFYDQVSRLPAKYSIVGGYRIQLIHTKHMAYLEDEKEISVTPTFLYRFQGKSDQLDIGLYGLYDQALVGLWYRGIPFKKYDTQLQNNESVVVQLGWHFQSFSLGYSYDFVVSKLAPARPYGAHEINLTYIYHKKHRGAKPMKRLPCPHFYK